MPYVDKVKSVKKTRGFPNRDERYGVKYENGVAYLLSYTVSVEKLWTQNTCIIHDVWRLLILSNEEKRNDYENFEKGMIYMKILKKGGGGGEEETKSMPHAPVIFVHFKGFNISQKLKSSPLSYFAQKTSLNMVPNWYPIMFTCPVQSDSCSYISNIDISVHLSVSEIATLILSMSLNFIKAWRNDKW